MKIWITGGAGFIGSNLAKKLNNMGINDILIIDDLTNGEKFSNLKGIAFSEFIDVEDFFNMLDSKLLEKPKFIFHQGAITNTLERNGKLMFKYNYTYSIKLLNWSCIHKIPFIYASSASVYGLNEKCLEDKIYEDPINVYGYSKLAFDNYVREKLNTVNTQIVGLRYFNVYGDGEQNKGKMASTIFQFYNQYKNNKKIKLFGEYLGFGKGLQLRDFIYVEDVVNTILWFHQNENISGIFNLGTGVSASFNDVAKEIISNHTRLNDEVFNDVVEYIDFPEELKGRYQCFTLANMNSLKKIGFEYKFLNIKEGISKYIKKLKANKQ